MIWADESDFLEDHCRLTEADIRNRSAEHVWPDYADVWRLDTPDLYTPDIYKANRIPTQSAQSRNISVKHCVMNTFDVEIGRGKAIATLPDEYVTDIVQKLWENKNWNEIISENHAEEYIAEVADTGTAGPVPCDISTIVEPLPKWVWDKYKDYYLGWFRTHRKDVAAGLQAEENHERIPVKLPPEYGQKIKSHGKSKTKTNKRSVFTKHDVRIHRKRYEGWDKESASSGCVKRFDTETYRWVELPVEKVPPSERRY